MSLKIRVKFLWRKIIIPSCHLGFLQLKNIYLHQSVWTILVTKLIYWWPSMMNCVYFFTDFVNGDSILTETNFLWFSWEHFWFSANLEILFSSKLHSSASAHYLNQRFSTMAAYWNHSGRLDKIINVMTGFTADQVN